MALAHLSIGSNCGDRILNISHCLQEIRNKIGTIVKQSLIYESQSWGYVGQNFLNMAIMVETPFSPINILSINQEIEKEAGRVKTPGRYSDRAIDIDILFYNNEIVSSEDLKIPHPQLQNRLFVLVPLMDIDPEYHHPVLGKTVKQLKDECSDKGWIKKFSDQIMGDL